MNCKNTPTQRKRRTDRNHAIYELFCEVTGESYIGITVVSGTALSSVRGRFNRHLSRANTESKNWNLCEALRTYGREGLLLTCWKWCVAKQRLMPVSVN
jgi:hypothetical protein